LSLKEELRKEVADIFGKNWSVRDGNVVPADVNLKLSNDAVNLEATVLYADMADSTTLVQQQKRHFAAEIYKAFLHCAAKIITEQGGTVTAYDGDRVMAVYIGDPKGRSTSAVRTALKIRGAVRDIITPSITSQYGDQTYVPQHVVGIDTSTLFVARTGVRGANDLVWVGRAANYAAKLAGLPHDYPTYITEEVYDQLDESMRLLQGKEMWEPRSWTAMGDKLIYRSNYFIPFS
jgi:class 3 adenylate cyclase